MHFVLLHPSRAEDHQMILDKKSHMKTVDIKVFVILLQLGENICMIPIPAYGR